MSEDYEDAVDEVRTLIIGAGLGGVGMALELDRRGDTEYLVLEGAPSVGGVWRDNRYPNAAVDTPIELYAFADAPGSKWTSNYAPRDEILEYVQDLVAEHKLEPRILFNTMIESLEWDEGARVWHARASDGRRWKARFVVWAGGLFSHPVVPAWPGLDDFEGPVLHTSRWSEDVDLHGRSVVVVGGGASSIQVVPYAADVAERVHAIIRTPSYVMPKPEKFYDDADRARFRAGPEMQAAERARWMEIFEELSRTRFPMDSDRIAETEARWRESFDLLVTDPEVRRVLTPDYRFGCRRPLFSNSYYPAFQKPSVTALGGTISEVFADGVMSTEAGRIDADALIFATGFNVQGMLGSLHIANGRGLTLAEAWADRPRAYIGSLVKGFPNLFLINGPNVGGPVVTDVIVHQSSYIADCLEFAAAPGLSVEIDPEVFDSYNADVEDRASKSVLILGGCTSYYRAAGGVGGVFSHWPGALQDLLDTISSAPREDLILSEPPVRSVG